jgi:hypothetical protein
MELHEKKQLLGLMPITQELIENHLIRKCGHDREQAGKYSCFKSYNGTHVFYSHEYLNSHDLDYLKEKSEKNTDYFQPA